MSARQHGTDVAPADNPEGLALALLAAQVSDLARDGCLVSARANGVVLAEALWGRASVPDDTDR